jgi:hypothetical protein
MDSWEAVFEGRPMSFQMLEEKWPVLFLLTNISHRSSTREISQHAYGCGNRFRRRLFGGKLVQGDGLTGSRSLRSDSPVAEAVAN